jgi:excinuclease ABC subunit A
VENITIRGAKTHNLKNIDVVIPRDKFVVITGLSGSGKSSLAFDTLYAEGQRRYVESLSSYARQFLSMMEKPDVEQIEGLSPAISIEQKSTSHNPRSTVGTVTEIYDYLRLLYARVGEPCCPKHGTVLEAQTISQMVDAMVALSDGTKIMLLAPIVRNRKGEYHKLIENLKTQGFVRARVDGELYELDDIPALDLHKKHTIDVVIDRLKIRSEIRQRLAESLETAIQLSGGLAVVHQLEAKAEDIVFSAKFACSDCGYSIAELEPRLFSFNNPVGACPRCDGLGVKQFFDEDKVIHNDELSLAGGAIRGWDRRTFYYYHLLLSLAKHYEFDIETPYKKLPKKIRQKILYGSGNEEISFRFEGEGGRVHEKHHAFEGVLPNMERRYHETESMAVREELTKYLTVSKCHECHGMRLNEAARHVFVGGKALPDATSLSIDDTQLFFQKIKFTGKRKEIAGRILKEIQQRLQFLIEVGLDYLTLARSAETLSGGEAQRIRLASQIGSGLVGVMYILDEPSIGLHQRDNQRLLKTLTYLRDLGNTVIVVEHDEEAIRAADHVIDIGVGAGVHGGTIVAQGTVKDLLKCKASLTGQYLSGERSIKIPEKRMKATKDRLLTLSGATANNLHNLTVEIPVGLMTCVTGVSGSGKSSLINDTLYPIAATQLNRASQIKIAPYRKMEGLEWLDKVVDINQSPIGRTPRSNPATYTGLFTPIRELFAATQEARSRGYKPGRFSFNVKGGRCEACQGDGVIKVEMHFLADMYVKCDMCKGKRYNRETLEIHYKGKSIAQVLAMTVEEGHVFFSAIPVLARKLQTLMDVGLSYITLGQSAVTLSGGEAQRVKLSRELSKRATGRTLYILDEPTTGLHFHDIEQLLKVLHHLRDQGNTVIIIEHNLDVIKTADWVIDLGPEGGHKGGKIVAQGTPEAVAKVKGSYTGQFLKKVLGG